MKQKYDLKLQSVETFPAFAKFYVHIPRIFLTRFACSGAEYFNVPEI